MLSWSQRLGRPSGPAVYPRLSAAFPYRSPLDRSTVAWFFCAVANLDSLTPQQWAALNGNPRVLSASEIGILRSVYGGRIDYNRVRIYNRTFLPGMRTSAPNGGIYFAEPDYLADFGAAGSSLSKRSVFVHEGAHLYQWYVLNQTVWARGPFDRNYEYELVPGRAFKDYGLEQMGMIAQHYYILREGGSISDRRYQGYKLADYQTILPVN